MSVCRFCQSEMKLLKTEFTQQTMTLGAITILDVERIVCTNQACGQVLLTSENLVKLQNKIDERETNALEEIPIKYYMSASEAIESLSISRQAFNKNLKNQNRKFILSIKRREKTRMVRWYLRPSLEAYMETGDGRIRLDKLISQRNTVTGDTCSISLVTDYLADAGFVDRAGYSDNAGYIVNNLITWSPDELSWDSKSDSESKQPEEFRPGMH